MKLNIGSGSTRYDGFLNCDYDSRYNPEYVFDLETDHWPFEDNSVDEVIAHHVLEHMGEGFFHTIKELYRVCSHDALIDIRVPHPNHITFLADPTHRRPITVPGLWLFSKKQNEAHKNTPASQLGYYYDVDFEVLDYTEIPEEQYIKMFDGKPVGEVEQYMREHNNIIIETQIKLVVIKND